MQKIWLDDVRPAPDGWEWCKTAEDAIMIIRVDAFMNDVGTPHLTQISDISLDHDLGEGVKTGYDVVKELEWCVAHCQGYRVPNITIHSMNPVGRENMQRAIDSIRR